ncbi:MAG: hypothetical protein LQ343_005393 [Gyalolechia ehrenbergii]|nr:MAG: hypothetical protein LQ343_005393 [Gyalolechia ehrenbergii]
MPALEEARLIMSRPSIAAFFAEAGNHRQTPPKRPLSVDTATTNLSMFIPGNDTLVDSPLLMSSSSSQHQSEAHLSTNPTSSSNDAHRDKSDASVGDPAAIALPISRPGSVAPEEVSLPASRSDSISSTATSSQYSTSRIVQDSSSDADISSNSDPFIISPTFKPRYRRPRMDRRALDKGAMTLGDVSSYELMKRMTYFRPYITLRQYVNFIIEYDIILPTEEEMDGDREWNAAECEYAASIPLKSESFFTKEESVLGEFCGADPCCNPPSGDDLADIGAPSLYYNDPATGKIKKQIGEFNLMDPRHPANVAARWAAQEMETEEALQESVGGERETTVVEAFVDEIKAGERDSAEEEGAVY